MKKSRLMERAGVLLVIMLLVSMPVYSADILLGYGEEETGESIIINVKKYQPKVVVSSVIEERDTPVYAYLSATSLGALIAGEDSPESAPFYGLPKIKSITIRPQGRDSYRYIKGSPLYVRPQGRDYTQSDRFIDLGYLIITLRKMQERDIPDVINLNLSAKIRYDLEYGIGEFGAEEIILNEYPDEDDWRSNKEDGLFWGGKGYVWATKIEDDKVYLRIYDSYIRNVMGSPVLTTSKPISNYMKAGGDNPYVDFFRVRLDAIDVPKKTAELYVQVDGKIEKREVAEGMRLYPGSDWIVDDIDLGKTIADKGGDKLKDRTVDVVELKHKKGYVVPVYVEHVTPEESEERYSCENVPFVDDDQLMDLANVDSKSLYCTAIKELEELIGFAINTKTKDYAYLLLGQLYEEVGDYVKSSESYQNSGHLDAGIAYARVEGLVSDNLKTKWYPLEDYEEDVFFEEDFDEEGWSRDSSYVRVKLLRVKDVALKDLAYAIIHIKGKDPVKVHPGSILPGEYSDKRENEFDWVVDDISTRTVTIKQVYENGDEKGREVLNLDRPELIEGKKGENNVEVKVSEIETKKTAKITILPGTGKSVSVSEFSVHIPVEKRGIKLSPSQIAEQINITGRLIDKLDKVIDTADKWITGMKVACLSTFAVISVMNLVKGPATVKAREHVMKKMRIDGGKIDDSLSGKTFDGWSDVCGDENVVGWDKLYNSYDDCIFSNREVIESATGNIKNAYDEVNEFMDKRIDKYVDDGKLKDDASNIFENERFFEDVEFEEEMQKNLDTATEGMLEKGFSLNSLEDLRLQWQLCQKEGEGGDACNDYKVMIDRYLDDGINYMEDIGQLEQVEDKLISELMDTEYENLDKKEGKVSYENLNEKQREALNKKSLGAYGRRFVDVRQKQWLAISSTPTETISNIKDFEDVEINVRNTIEYVSGDKYWTTNDNPENPTIELYPLKVQEKEDGEIIEVKDSEGRVVYSNVNKVLEKENDKYDTSDLNLYVALSESYGGSMIRNSYSPNAVAQYYDDGKPYCIPTNQAPSTGEGRGGNYIKIEHMGGEERVSLWNVGADGVMCNVGDDGEDDDVLIMHESVLDNQFGPDSRLKSRLINEIKSATGMCKDERGRLLSFGSLGGYQMGCSYESSRVSRDATKLHCTDVMGIKECWVLYNVCDPVMCPASRFDLGGRWPLSSSRSVVETGILGSLVLGIPNSIYAGGTNVIPFCLTGISSGMKGWRSVLEGYKECLHESQISGKNVGICDRIKSVYWCELAWREGIAIFNVLGGNQLFGKRVSGGSGSEYASVADFRNNIENIGNAAKFFTQDYAQSAFAAYKARTTQEVGGQICQSAIYGKGPNLGEFVGELAKPESPPQFTAFFDESEWSDAYRTSGTVGRAPDAGQGQSRYSVYYHIYAGEDQNIRYSVFLTDSPVAGQYVSGANRVYITECKYGYGSRSYISKGDYVDHNCDFIARSGMTQICVELNGRVECGFGKASTSFGVNYMNDLLVQDEAGREINSAEQCVSDHARTTPSTGSLILPGEYGLLSNTGIRRVCSEVNPGRGTNEVDWQIVGSCGEDDAGHSLGKCWIDRRSIDINDLSIYDETEGVLDDLLAQYDEEYQLRKNYVNERWKDAEVLFDKWFDFQKSLALNCNDEDVSELEGDLVVLFDLYNEVENLAGGIDLLEKVKIRKAFIYKTIADWKKYCQTREEVKQSVKPASGKKKSSGASADTKGLDGKCDVYYKMDKIMGGSVETDWLEKTITPEGEREVVYSEGDLSFYYVDGEWLGKWENAKGWLEKDGEGENKDLYSIKDIANAIAKARGGNDKDELFVKGFPVLQRFAGADYEEGVEEVVRYIGGTDKLYIENYAGSLRFYSDVQEESMFVEYGDFDYVKVLSFCSGSDKEVSCGYCMGESCSKDTCHKQGVERGTYDCYFDKGFIGSNCKNCYEVDECSDLNDDVLMCNSETCLNEADLGKGLNCQIVNGKCVEVENIFGGGSTSRELGVELPINFDEDSEPNYDLDVDIMDSVGYLNDFENYIFKSIKPGLENKMKAIKKEFGYEVAIVTLNPTQDDSRALGHNLFNEWGIGDSEEDNGILILISPELGVARIQIGWGVDEDVFNVALASRWIHEHLFEDGYLKSSEDIGIGLSNLLNVIKNQFENPVEICPVYCINKIGELQQEIAPDGVCDTSCWDNIEDELIGLREDEPSAVLGLCFSGCVDS